MTTKLDTTRNAMWRIFLTTHATVIDLIEQDLASAELPPLSWYDVLLALDQAPEHRLRMHELASNIVLSRSNLTRLVDRLEAAGLLCRESCPTDRRGAYAVITDSGLAMRQRMWPVYAQAIAKYFTDRLDDQQVEAIATALNQVLTHIYNLHSVKDLKNSE